MEVKYNQIGKAYNRTRKADKLLTENILRLLNPKKDGLYLDIGCGTGNYTAEFYKKGFQIIGIDPSEKMLEKARANNPEIDWRLGSAEKTGLKENSINGIFGTLTIHHWENLEMAFLEFSRILKPKGKLLLFTSTPQQMQGYWLNHYFPKMMADSIEQMPALERIFTAMDKADIKILETEKYFIQPDLEDKFLYCGKQNPELYFKEEVRNGISSFSSLSNKSEVENGLLKLKEDFESGKIETIIKDFENNLGDYLYIVAEKEK